LSILFMLGKNLLFSTLINSHRPSDNPVIGSNIRIDGSKYTEKKLLNLQKMLF